MTTSSTASWKFIASYLSLLSGISYRRTRCVHFFFFSCFICHLRFLRCMLFAFWSDICTPSSVISSGTWHFRLAVDAQPTTNAQTSASASGKQQQKQCNKKINTKTRTHVHMSTHTQTHTNLCTRRQLLHTIIYLPVRQALLISIVYLLLLLFVAWHGFCFPISVLETHIFYHTLTLLLFLLSLFCSSYLTVVCKLAGYCVALVTHGVWVTKLPLARRLPPA